MGKHKYNCPRRIMFKFNKFKEEQKTLRNEKKKKKNTEIYIYEDFCEDTMALSKSLWMKVLDYHR